MKNLLTLSLLFVGSALASRAQTLIDFDAKTSGVSVQQGPAVLGLSTNSTKPDVWNAVGLAADSSLVDSTGTAIGITYADTTESTNSTFGNGGGTAYDSATSNLEVDYIDVADSTIQIALGALSAYQGDAFTLVLYGAGDTAGQGAAFTLTSGATGGNTASTLDTTGLSRQISKGIGVAYQTFNGTLTGDDLDFTVAANGSQYAALNGFQLEISDTPEPGTWALLLAGILGLWAVNRRRCRV